MFGLRINRRVSRRLSALESGQQSRTLSLLPKLNVEDEVFFEHMLARALAHDRDWTAAEKTRYHNILLGETEQ